MYKNMIKKLRDKAECHDYNGWVETAVELEEAADAIEELSRLYAEERNAAVELTGELASKPRWIPVTEKLPETNVTVIVTDGRSTGMGWIDSYDWEDYRGIERIWYAPNTLVAENNITHWMPLPEPPKEEA